MVYKGKFDTFDTETIKTYSFKNRINKVLLADLMSPGSPFPAATGAVEEIRQVASAIVDAGKAGRPVIVFTGAHLIKNGLSRLLVDFVERGLVTLVAGNGATCIHDFELALMGETSEYVPDALGKGLFGMAAEFAYINTALTAGNELKLGMGESLGRMMCDEQYRSMVISRLGANIDIREFLHPEISVMAACYAKGIPFTAHVGIGTDVIDQHPSFDGEAKGGCSGRDFLIYTQETTRLTKGGVILNIGSAVTGPEVLLKALSMSANTGKVPDKIITADFDIRALRRDHVADESKEGYYFRDQKSVVARIPEAFNGEGLYIQGDQKNTIPALHRAVIELTRKQI